MKAIAEMDADFARNLYETLQAKVNECDQASTSKKNKGKFKAFNELELDFDKAPQVAVKECIDLVLSFIGSKHFSHLRPTLVSKLKIDKNDAAKTPQTGISFLSKDPDLILQAGITSALQQLSKTLEQTIAAEDTTRLLP